MLEVNLLSHVKSRQIRITSKKISLVIRFCKKVRLIRMELIFRKGICWRRRCIRIMISNCRLIKILIMRIGSRWISRKLVRRRFRGSIVLKILLKLIIRMGFLERRTNRILSLISSKLLT